MRPIVDRAWTDLHSRVGDDLRVVTRYETREFETRIREDIREQYTTDEDRAIVDDTRSFGLWRATIEGARARPITDHNRPPFDGPDPEFG